MHEYCTKHEFHCISQYETFVYFSHNWKKQSTTVRIHHPDMLLHINELFGNFIHPDAFNTD